MIRACEVILGCGGGHTGIINALRNKGHSYEEAKRLSYFYFDEAKKRLMRSQLGSIILANGLILLGIMLPVILLIMDTGFLIVAGGPIILGVFLKSKILNPSRLPEN
jgi:hypothetical protein